MFVTIIIVKLVHYCSTHYVGPPAVHLGCFERVIRTAACLIGGIPRTGHVSAYMLDVLHRLPLQQRIIFRIGALVWRYILGLAPAYLRDHCCATPAPDVAVHSAHWNRGYSLFPLLVPLQPRPVHSRWLDTLCGMGFLCRNDCSPGFSDTFYSSLKTLLLAVQWSGALLSSNLKGRYINLRNVRMNEYIHTCIHTYIHTYMHTYIHTYIHTYTHIYIHACIHTHVYIHTYM